MVASESTSLESSVTSRVRNTEAEENARVVEEIRDHPQYTADQSLLQFKH